MKNIITFLVLFAISSIASYGQIIQSPVALPSPNAAGLGCYGEVPASPYTGMACIEIPLCELKTGSHIIPVSLTYNTGGVRADQHPGWVGLNWNLNAGGCITRTVYGIQDEYNPKNGLGEPMQSGYYYNHSKLSQDWDSETSLANSIQTLINEYEHNRDKGYEYEPDRFSFNFLDYHGNFYLDSSGEWVVQCNRQVKVEFDEKDGFTNAYCEPSDFFPIEKTPVWSYIQSRGGSHSFKKFILIGEDGTRYTFGGDDNAIEFSVPFFLQLKEVPVATTWNLTKIEYTDGRAADFNYHRGAFIVQSFNNYQEYSLHPVKGDATMCSYSSAFNPLSITGSLIMPSYLGSINCGIDHISINTSPTKELEYDLRNRCDMYSYMSDPTMFLAFLSYATTKPNADGSVTSVPYPECLNKLEWRMINNIYCYTSSGIHFYRLGYTKDKNMRLMLQTISDEAPNPHQNLYQFEYYHPELLPKYLSFQTDGWGFFNDHDPARGDSFYDSREPNPAVSHYGSLSKITYPTGGFSKLVYEPHQYSKEVSDNRSQCNANSTVRYAGGLRIKKITNSSTGQESDTVTVKEYFYTADYLKNGSRSLTSSGVLLQPVKTSYDNYLVKTIDGNIFRMNLKSARSVLPFSPNTSNTHIGYSEVVEVNPDKSFTIYKYTNFDNGYHDEPPVYTTQPTIIQYTSYSSRDQDRGLLTAKEEYTPDKRLKHQEVYTYTPFQLSKYPTKIKSFHLLNYSLCSSSASNNYHDGTAYYHYTHTNLLSKKQSVDYDETGNSFRSDIYFTHDTLGRVKMIQTYGNQKLKTETFLQYPSAFVSQQGKYRQMHDAHIYSTVITSSTRESMGGALNFVMKRQFNRYNTNVFAPSSIDVSYGEGELHEVVRYTYDKYGNVSTEKPFDGPVTSYQWGFKGERLLATITGSTFGANALVDLCKYSNSDYAAIINGNANKYPMTVFKYDKWGFVTDIYDTAHRKRYFSYDASGRLVSILNYMEQNIATFHYNYSNGN